MILLGTNTIVGNVLQLKPPLGFGGGRGVRLTNLSTDVVVLTNVSGTDQSQEYLLPRQTMVYQSANVSGTPTAYGLTLPIATVAASFYSEWSTDPLTDFVGTYPSSVRSGGASPVQNGVTLDAWSFPDQTVATANITTGGPNATVFTLISTANNPALPTSVTYNGTNVGANVAFLQNTVRGCVVYKGTITTAGAVAVSVNGMNPTCRIFVVSVLGTSNQKYVSATGSGASQFVTVTSPDSLTTAQGFLSVGSVQATASTPCIVNNTTDQAVVFSGGLAAFSGAAFQKGTGAVVSCGYGVLTGTVSTNYTAIGIELT